jgi:uncharacterized protein YegJ (DUF2314 family)
MYKLENVEKLAREHPESFKILPKEARETLQKGDFAKVMFSFPPPSEGDPDGERMWVLVSNPTLDGRTYLGILQNKPLFAPDVKHGDLIYFKPENVCQIMRAGDAITTSEETDPVDYTHKDCNDMRWR